MSMEQGMEPKAEGWVDHSKEHPDGTVSMEDKDDEWDSN